MDILNTGGKIEMTMLKSRPRLIEDRSNNDSEGLRIESKMRSGVW